MKPDHKKALDAVADKVLTYHPPQKTERSRSRRRVKKQVSRVSVLEDALKRLANAADAVGVAHYDTDDMSDEVTEMQAATLAARKILP